MDGIFDERWRVGAPPFSGQTLEAEYLPGPRLRMALAAAVRVLERDRPGPLWKLFDWHEHDGYRTSPARTSWAELRAALASDETLFAYATDDTFVRVGIFPDDRVWYFRFCVTSDPDDFDRKGQLPGGVFDLSGPARALDDVEREIAGAAVLLRSSSTDFFRSAWGG